MMKILAICCALFTLAAQYEIPFKHKDSSSTSNQVISDVFTNPIDHVNHFSQGTFQQRYWYDLELWNNQGPILLYICGAGPGEFPRNSSFVMTLANEFKAVVVSLEHRFYGTSIPSSEFTMKNLKYLNPTQALADIACFVAFFKSKLSSKAKGPIKLFTIGGGYAGALAAWVRYQYPHLVDGALSSSGIVNSTLDFTEFEEQVNRTYSRNGKECLDNIVYMILDTRRIWKSNSWFIRDYYKAPYAETDDFMYFFSDIFVEAAKDGERTKMCAFLKSIKDDRERHKKLYQFAERHEIIPNAYSFEYIRTIQSDPINNYRQWTYQICSTLGNFNTATENPLRFEEMNLEYWRRYCGKAFDVPMFPDTFHTNALFGGERIQDHASNIIFTNGIEDPWQWAGIRS